MPSARQHLPRLLVAACSGALLLGANAGCSTTQEKAAAHQAEAERILEARAKRQAQKKNKQKGDKDSASPRNGGKKQ